jgi:hypothetical protein
MTGLVAASPVPTVRMARAGLASFVMLMAGVLVLGMVGLLVFSTALQDQAFSVNEKRTQANELANKLTGLESQLASANSLTALAARAQDLGMRPNPYPAQLVLGSGKVIGDPQKVYGREVPGATYRTPEEQEAYSEKVEEKAKKARAAKKAAEQAKKEKEAKKKAEAEAEKKPTGQTQTR